MSAKNPADLSHREYDKLLGKVIAKNDDFNWEQVRNEVKATKRIDELIDTKEWLKNYNKRKK